jgi:hypothetical protein
MLSYPLKTNWLPEKEPSVLKLYMRTPKTHLKVLPVCNDLDKTKILVAKEAENVIVHQRVVKL